MPEHEPYYIYDDSDLQGLFKRYIAKFGNLQPATEIIGDIIQTSILRNFEEGGRPEAWQDLADSTKKQRKKKGKWPGQILVVSGTRGGLISSISYDAMPDKVVFVANKPYAAIHHFGGMACKGHKVEIPARPFMMILDEDWEEINAALNEFILEV
ncbi:phage virion morphogenesis protein [Desulfobacula phenolica]|uniref:Phage virion morphogenesis (Putative tail completion) protein n=1 Tax=Desulfobacula phenolica TaxID=90732 RepID=A0A1H2H5L8_9BACT|nr:phage virion morphogenesis protein [Desulfobacula phenolica]SDU26878.1 phage virion morphogenesis (putative tail completion) protein [Desulfobacula phenolica]